MARYRVTLQVELDAPDSERADARVFWAIVNDIEDSNITTSGVEHIEATRRCGNCARTVDAREIEGCPFCGTAWDDDDAD